MLLETKTKFDERGGVSSLDGPTMIITQESARHHPGEKLAHTLGREYIPHRHDVRPLNEAHKVVTCLGEDKPYLLDMDHNHARAHQHTADVTKTSMAMMYE